MGTTWERACERERETTNKTECKDGKGPCVSNIHRVHTKKRPTRVAIVQYARGRYITGAHKGYGYAAIAAVRFRDRATSASRFSGRGAPALDSERHDYCCTARQLLCLGARMARACAHSPREIGGRAVLHAGLVTFHLQKLAVLAPMVDKLDRGRVIV